jgi:CRP-like cAMP-binding protein
MRAMDAPPIRLYANFEYLGSATTFVEDILEIIDSIALFDDFSRQEIEEFCSYMDCYGAPRNAVLLGEGEQGGHLIVIFTGQAKIIKRDVDDSEKWVGVVGPGAMLGEMSLIDGQPRSASCVTAEPTDFAVLTRDNLNEILVTSPRLANKLFLVLLQKMTRRLRDISNRLLPYLPETPL